MTTADLMAKYEREKAAEERAEIQRETQLQLWLHRVYLKARDQQGRVLAQNAANDGLLREFAGLPDHLLFEAIKKNAGKFLWTDPPEIAEKKDRTAFTEFVRQHSLGDNEANWRLTRQFFKLGE